MDKIDILIEKIEKLKSEYKKFNIEMLRLEIDNLKKQVIILNLDIVCASTVLNEKKKENLDREIFYLS